MRQSERPPARRASRSESYGRVSLVLTKDNFLDTLIVNRSSGVPIYATVTEAGSTVLYAIDTRMTLQRVATLDWGKGGRTTRKDARVTVGGRTRSLEDALLANKGTLEGLKPIAMTHNYSHGHFACRWAQQDDQWGSRCWIGCFSTAPVTHSSQPYSSPSLTPQSCPGAPFGDFQGTVLATLEFGQIPQKPKVIIHVYAPELREQTLGEDGLTELDHVILGALLICASPPGERKKAAKPARWMNEDALQSLLWSCLEGPSRGEIPPLYALIAEALGGSDVGGVSPPPYASRITLCRHRSQ